MSFRCDVCGREVNGITIVNGMNFCAKCYQETFAIPKALSVQDLENCVKIGCTQCKQKDKRIAELESEVERLKAKLEIWNRFNKEDYIHKGEKATERDYYYYTNGASSVLENEVEQLKANQNKVAIEKLGELENWINQPYTKGDCYYLNRGATIETTDLQQKIKELKGDK